MGPHLLSKDGRAAADRRAGRPFLVPRAPCGRLTLTSGNAFPTASVTGAATVYYTPHWGNFAELYDTTAKQWIPRTFSELSVAVPSTLFRLFDLFLYWTGNACALETVNWNQSTAALTAATAAAPSVVTSNAHGNADGTLLGLAGLNNTVGSDATNGLNGTVWTVASSAANTFAAQGSNTAGLAASTTGNWYSIPNTRATALTTQDGRPVKSGDASRLYLGTGMTTGVSGQCECSFGGIDSVPLWLLWNYYHRAPVQLQRGDGTDSWTYTTATWRALNNRGKLARAGFVIGLSEPALVSAEALVVLSSSAGAQAGTALDLDGVSLPENFLRGLMFSNGYFASHAARYAARPGIGFHYLAQLEFSEAVGVTTFAGDAGDPATNQSGMSVFLEA